MAYRLVNLVFVRDPGCCIRKSDMRGTSNVWYGQPFGRCRLDEVVCLDNFFMGSALLGSNLSAARFDDASFED